MGRTIRIGSRGSDLALWQARYLQSLLAGKGYASQIIVIKTQGDVIQHLSLEKLEGKGFFTKEIEEALLQDQIDVAVHSFKDLPTQEIPRLVIAAVSEREDPSETLLILPHAYDATKKLGLKEHAIVGTSSGRRFVQLKHLRPDLQCKDIRGNVPTRVQKLRKGDFDAILIATAGLKRLNLETSDLHRIILPIHRLIPAPAQGALAFQCRADDTELFDTLFALQNEPAHQSTRVERKILALFKGGCQMPLGAHCFTTEKGYAVYVSVARDREDIMHRVYIEQASADGLAERAYAACTERKQRRVFISADIQQKECDAMRTLGLEIEGRSLLAFSPIAFQQPTDVDWYFFTSKNGVRFFLEGGGNFPPGVRIAAIGEETAFALQKAGVQVDFIGDIHIAARFAQLAAGNTVAVFGALHHADGMLKALSVDVQLVHIAVYNNTIDTDARIPDADIYGCTSAMQAEAILRRQDARSNIFIAIGESTAAYLKAQGVTRVHISPQRNMQGILDLICGL